MAYAVVEEYVSLAEDSKGTQMAVPLGPPIVVQGVTYTTSTATAAALNARTRYIFIQTVDTQAFVDIAPTPTATVAKALVPAGGGRFFGVQNPSALKVALYDGSS